MAEVMKPLSSLCVLFVRSKGFEFEDRRVRLLGLMRSCWLAVARTVEYLPEFLDETIEAITAKMVVFMCFISSFKTTHVVACRRRPLVIRRSAIIA